MADVRTLAAPIASGSLPSASFPTPDELVAEGRAGLAATVARRPAGAGNLSAALLVILRAQIGVTEHPLGSNDGPEVRRYLLAAGAGPGDPWCAALQHWAFAQIGQPGHGAYCPTWFPKARRVGAEAVRPGDQLGIVFLSLGRIAHIGTVEEVRRREVVTIEGNTNAQGSREGDRCARRIRDRQQAVYARWLPL